MNSKTLIIAAAIAFNCASAASFANATPEERARAAAQESPDALRQFVQRTRMIYALDINDFTNVRDDATEPSAPAEPAAWPEPAQAPAPAVAPDPDQQKREQELAAFREQIYRDMLHE
jgi:hypothetical protein